MNVRGIESELMSITNLQLIDAFEMLVHFTLFLAKSAVAESRPRHSPTRQPFTPTPTQVFSIAVTDNHSSNQCSVSVKIPPAMPADIRNFFGGKPAQSGEPKAPAKKTEVSILHF
jgi:hypothetical protein